MFNPDLCQKAEALLARCRDKGLMIASAESCTGGLIAGLFTEIAGSSDVFERGFVTYSNAAKSDLLGVPEVLLQQYGAVSPQVAAAMARGALENSRAGLSVAVTGIAGPGGGSAEKPVGLVCLAARVETGGMVEETCRFGDRGRSAVREATLFAALQLMNKALDQDARWQGKDSSPG